MSEDPVVALVLVRAGEAEPVGRALRADGFEVGDSPDGGWVIEGGGRELPLGALPPELAARIQAVTFEEPAEPVP